MKFSQITRWCLTVVLLMPAFAMASESEIYTRFFNNLALEGYDAYVY